MKYVFDIDGTICTNTAGEYENAKPFRDRIVKINKLYDDGNVIIFQTARGMGRSGNSSAYAYQAFVLRKASLLCEREKMFLALSQNKR